MSISGNSNSALVLATLGVYFGLLLSGASQAHASGLNREYAAIRSFEHAAFSDDPRTPLSVSVQIYLEDLEYFLAALGRLADQRKFDAVKDTFEVVQTVILPCTAGNRAGRYTPVKFESSSDHARSTLVYLSRGMTYGYSLGDCVPHLGFKDVPAVDSRFELRLADKGLFVDVSVKKGSRSMALGLSNALRRTLTLYLSPQNTRLRQEIVERTRIDFRDDLVFIRFHLARSDLISLLTRG